MEREKASMIIIKRYINGTFYIVKGEKGRVTLDTIHRLKKTNPIKIIDNENYEDITQVILKGKYSKKRKIIVPTFNSRDYYKIKWRGLHYTIVLGNNITYNPRIGKYSTSKVIKGKKITKTCRTIQGIIAFKSVAYEFCETI